jgi:hypothetical protein
MASKKKVHARTSQGRELARKLYDHSIRELETLSAEDKARLRAEFPSLGEVEFRDVLRQVIEAKQFERERIGWQAIPHDVTVLVFVLVTALLNLPSGVVAGIATLVLLESVFQFYFNRDLYRPLSTVVWLTYPAYLLLAYVLYRRGYAGLWIIAAVLLAWGGTFLLSPLARLPARMMWQGRARGAADAIRLREERRKKDRQTRDP